MEDYLVRKRPEYLGKVKVKFPRINRLFIHMSNASQHFKSTGTIEFVNHFFKEREMEEPNASILIAFGFPFHGKGAWVSLQ